MNVVVAEVVEPVLSRRHEKVIVALLANPTMKVAAEEAGVSGMTIWRLMQDEAFQRRYREAQSKALESALGSLQGAATEAIDTLRQISRDGKHETARVQAAKTIIDCTLKIREQFDFNDRLKAVEARLRDREDGA